MFKTMPKLGHFTVLGQTTDPTYHPLFLIGSSQVGSRHGIQGRNITKLFKNQVRVLVQSSYYSSVGANELLHCFLIFHLPSQVGDKSTQI